MSGVGGPLRSGGDDALLDEVTLAVDASEAERAAIVRRIGKIAAAFQREASEGMVPLAMVEVRLVALSDDVRAGIHGGAG